MVLAFGWWSVLLYEKNKETFNAKVEYLQLALESDIIYTQDSNLSDSGQYLALKKKFERQSLMIVGEAFVFVLTLMIALWLINRSYYSEIKNANAHKNFLLAVTHELKSPVSSIKLVLNTLKKRDLTPTQTQSLLTSSIEENNRLERLIENILLASRLESKYNSTLEKFSTRELLNEYTSRLALRWPLSRIEITIEDLPEYIYFDRKEFHLLLDNLVENAIKYSPKDSIVHLKFSGDETSLFIHCSDNGPGIPKKEKVKVWKKFYRIGSEMIRETQGSGLGLYLVKRIVDHHKGEISISDNKPIGTIISVKFPA